MHYKSYKQKSWFPRKYSSRGITYGDYDKSQTDRLLPLIQYWRSIQTIQTEIRNCENSDRHYFAHAEKKSTLSNRTDQRKSLGRQQWLQNSSNEKWSECDLDRPAATYSRLLRKNRPDSFEVSVLIFAKVSFQPTGRQSTISKGSNKTLLSAM